MVNDIIADSITRVRNASMRKLDVTTLLYAKIVGSVVKNFEDKGYIDGFKVKEKDGKKSIVVALKYDENGNSVINELKRISKPGRRVYKGASELKKFKNGYGMIVVSTNKGVVSNEEAHKQSLGGELLCSIW